MKVLLVALWSIVLAAVLMQANAPPALVLVQFTLMAVILVLYAIDPEG